MFNTSKDPKSFIQKYAPESKIIISTPVLRVDKANAIDINKVYRLAQGSQNKLHFKR